MFFNQCLEGLIFKCFGFFLFLFFSFLFFLSLLVFVFKSVNSVVDEPISMSELFNYLIIFYNILKIC